MTALRWTPGLRETEQQAVRRLLADAARADGVAPVGEQVLRALSGAGSEHLILAGAGGDLLAGAGGDLLAGAGGDPVGYLNLVPGRDGADATAELVVAPDARRRGLGGALIRAAIERTGGRVRFWAHDTLPEARALAAVANLDVARELFRMARPLDGLGDVVVPQGVRIRTYTGRDDHAELLRVNNAAFSWHPEQGGWAESHLAERLSAPWFDPAGLFMAVDEDSGALLGFHWTKVHDGRTGEVYVLGVDPAAQGRGLGRTLTLAGLNHLAGTLPGADPKVILYVESDNTAAVKTYRGLGFEVAAVDTAYAPR